MKSLFLLAALCCLVFSACASPIARPEEDKEVGRQAAAAAPAAPAATSDDDDEDDDDDDDDEVVDLDDPLEDDDDDDDDDDEEEEADDDEDDDYLERFFDDILGGDDDDDDDEAAPVQAVVAPADTVAAAPAPVTASVASPEEAAAVSEEAAADAEEAEATEVEEAVQKEPASAEVETPTASSEVPAEPEEDDDEDDDVDIDDDDDDDDEAEDEDDDDDDDDITDALGRNVSAKNSRALTEETTKKPSTVPAIYIVKYNRFVDNILEKMNDILRTSYDPVSVKLQPIDASKKTSKPKKGNKTKPKRKTSNKKKNSARGSDANKTKEKTVSEIPEIAKEPQTNELKPNEVVAEQIPVVEESRAVKDKVGSDKAKAPVRSKPTLKPPTKTTKPKPKPTKTTTKKPPTNKNKTKTSEKSKPRAKGTLYGLSSLRRTGDVAVSIMADHTTVKSNFAVGPLILRVEKEIGRGAKKDIRSATATTAEMLGKLTLRVNNQGVATLHTIKVLQPKQVRVDSNNERTRELVWQRSARIAHVVSEKLLSASKPMFHQQQTVVSQ